MIAGSRRLPKGSAHRLLLGFVSALPPDAIVLIRGRASGQLGGFEYDLERLCRSAQLDWQVCTPWPIQSADDLPGQGERIGREGVLHRDRAMVELADVVLCFMAEDEVESDAFSGTRHLVESALSLEVPAFLYAVSDAGVRQVGAA